VVADVGDDPEPTVLEVEKWSPICVESFTQAQYPSGCRCKKVRNCRKIGVLSVLGNSWNFGYRIAATPSGLTELLIQFPL
jgi:hypothetical protein